MDATRVDDESMAGMLSWHSRRRPDATAVVCGDRRLSYRRLDERSERLASGLLSHGLTPGDSMAILLPNCIEYLELYEAAAKCGLTVVPINTGLTQPEIDYILDDSGVALVVADDRSTVKTALPVLTVGGAENPYEKLIEEAPDRIVSRPAPDAIFFQGYTSGTTGRPKGCLQTLAAFVTHFRRSFYLYGHDADDIMLLPGPLFHEAPTLFGLAQLFYGGTVVIMPRFDADQAVEALVREHVTLIGFAVPTMLDRMIPAAEGRETPALRGVITAGAPLHPETMDQVLRVFPTTALHEFYGGTEIGIVTSIEHRAARAHGSSVGTPIPGLDVTLLDDKDVPVAPGEIGQIYVTPRMMTGYHGRPEATAEATRTLGGVEWFSLGDLGRVDDNGHLFLVDRKSHMIISGGENVYPAEVEAVLIEHPDIVDVAVIGLPDPEWGEAVTAVITSAGSPPDVEALRSYARSRLAGYKLPRRVEVVPDIPRTASGKILKHHLRNDFA